MPHKLGRLRRGHDNRFPHYSAMRYAAKKKLIQIPPQEDWSAKMPPNLGMMLNDQLGNCVIACAYHAIQLWTFIITGQMVTQPNTLVRQAYSEVTGYDPNAPLDADGNNPTDQGTNMQDFLKYWLTKGLPVTNQIDPTGRHKLLAFFELDPRNLNDIDLASYETGIVSLGFNVPAYLMESDPPPTVWDLDPSLDNTILGGHCVGRPGFNAPAKSSNIVSWGSHGYSMTDSFWAHTVDEAYALVDPLWIDAKNQTPLGLTKEQCVACMQPIAVG